MLLSLSDNPAVREKQLSTEAYVFPHSGSPAACKDSDDTSGTSRPKAVSLPFPPALAVCNCSTSTVPFTQAVQQLALQSPETARLSTGTISAACCCHTTV